MAGIFSLFKKMLFGHSEEAKKNQKEADGSLAKKPEEEIQEPVPKNEGMEQEKNFAQKLKEIQNDIEPAFGTETQKQSENTLSHLKKAIEETPMAKTEKSKKILPVLQKKPAKHEKPSKKNPAVSSKKKAFKSPVSIKQEKKQKIVKKEKTQKSMHKKEKAIKTIEKMAPKKSKKNVQQMHEKVKALEDTISEMAKEHNVPQEELQKAGQDRPAKEVIREQETLSSIAEIEKKIDAAKQEDTQGVPKHKEILGLIEEIKKHRIITDFDRVYDTVLKEKRISNGQIANALEIPKSRVEECAKILEEDKLVEIDYPAIGEEIVQLTGYKKEKKQKKKKVV